MVLLVPHIGGEAKDHPEIAIAVSLVTSLVALVSVVFSLALACAMPFAGLAALAALVFGLRGAVGVSLLAWAMNQAVGYGFFGYPITVDSIGWGLVLGASAVTTVLAAHHVAGAIDGALRVPAAFIASFALQQGTVFSASFVLPSHPEAFALHVIVSLLAINALAFAILLILYFAIPAVCRPALDLT